jgi:apoptosis-inducing factor 3
MGDIPQELTGPDLAAGLSVDLLGDDALLHGHAFGSHVLLVRHANAFFAIGAHCSHYGVALVDGAVINGEVRCPLHHACFNLTTGAAMRAPAFDALARWHTEVRDHVVYVTAPIDAVPGRVVPLPQGDAPGMVIVGGGAAGNAAAELLRAEGYDGQVTILSADENHPPDRPNFSKGTIAGTIPHDYNFLRPAEFYRDRRIALRLGARVERIDPAAHAVYLAGGERVRYDKLLLATGATPIRLNTPGAELPHVHTVRSLADAEAIAAIAAGASSAVVIGASFIGLEVAAALRTRNVDVHVVAPDDIPMARVLGTDVGTFMRQLHEHHGVTFHLGTTVATIEAGHVTLASGGTLPADLVVMGVGVTPSTALAESAGLTIDNGVLVNEYLETSAADIFAAGDIARWPDQHTGTRMRVEHWVVAERHGQSAARNMMGERVAFDAVPFFWTEQYDVTLHYVGHAEKGFTATIDGALDVSRPDFRVDYRAGETLVAVATVGRDRESIAAEVAFERMRAARGG